MHDVPFHGHANLSRAAPATVDLVSFTGKALLVSIVPLSLIWVPVATVPGAGHVAAGDVAQMALWAVTAASLLTRSGVEVDFRAPFIALAAIATGVLAGIGAELTFTDAKGVLEFSQLMKRFGLASIVPLAATRFGSKAMGSWTRAMTAVMIGVLVAFTLDPTLQDWLPRPEDWDPNKYANEDRAIGSVANPNDLAYTSIALFILHAAFLPRRARSLDRVLLVASLVGAATCLFSSGSRSGVLGAAGALGYFILMSRIRIRTKAALCSATLVLAVAGLSYSSVFEQRLTKAYHEGFGEENVASRLEAQWLSTRAALAHPWGVGYTGLRRAMNEKTAFQLATADSVYCDTLLGAGFVGLLCLLSLLWTGWRHVGLCLPAGDPRKHALRAGLVAFLLFGAATVVPISVYLAPLFFMTIGAAAFGEGDAMQA